MSVSKTVLSMIGAAALALGVAGAANAAVIYPVNAAGSSSYPGYPDADAIDQDPGSAYSDWAALGQGANAFLNLDLGDVYSLDTAYVTDRVTSGGSNNSIVLGLYDFTTKFSFQAFSDASFSTASSAVFTFNHAKPVNPTQISDFLTTVSLGGLATRYLQYKVVATEGVNPGLSDLHFDGGAFAPSGGGAVPEPASWALMIVGFGAAGAMLRRRRMPVAA